MLHFLLILLSFFSLTQTASADGAAFCQFLKDIEKMEDARINSMQKTMEVLEGLDTDFRQQSITDIEKELASFKSALRDFESQTASYADGDFSALRARHMDLYNVSLEYLTSILNVLHANDPQTYAADMEQYSQKFGQFDQLFAAIEQETERLFTAYPYPCGVRLTIPSFIYTIVPGIAVVGFIIWWGFFKGVV
jgi:Na+/phosphate symporter